MSKTEHPTRGEKILMVLTFIVILVMAIFASASAFAEDGEFTDYWYIEGQWISILDGHRVGGPEHIGTKEGRYDSAQECVKALTELPISVAADGRVRVFWCTHVERAKVTT